jgi:hypothetical protein
MGKSSFTMDMYVINLVKQVQKWADLVEPPSPSKGDDLKKDDFKRDESKQPPDRLVEYVLEADVILR